MSFPRYTEYKDSGVEWLGQVPAHWGLARLKRSLRSERNGIWGAEPQGDENDIACVRVADFDRNRLVVSYEELTVRNVTEREREGRLLMPNDLLIEKSGGGETQPVGCVVLYTHSIEAVCSNFIARLSVADAMNASYWRYFHAAAYTSRMNVRSIKQTSGIQNLDTQAYFDELAVFPPLEEQDAIGRFLDGETAKIDSLVAEQERLIALLKEKRQAVISHAVTKGLNPDAPMKDSGIEWLGEVPSHWTVERLAHLFKDTNEQGSDQLPILSVSIHTGVSDTELDDAELDRKVNRSDDRSKYKRVLPDDLVYNMMRAWQGAFGTVRAQGMVSPAYVVARPRHGLETAFIEHQLRTPNAIEQMRRFSRGVTDFRLRLYWEEFKNIQVALPPPPEQRDIIQAVQEIDSKFDGLSAACSEAIEQLNLRRSALITAAVTGQIDVRGLAQAEAA